MWISMKVEFPKKGVPVLLKSWAGAVQKVTFYLDSDDEGDFWQDVDDNHDGFPINMGDHWMYLPEA